MTMETIRDIANSIDPMIQLTVDFPELNENGRVPILDLEVWLIRDDDGFQQIRYSFYEKPMKSQYVLMMKSAVPLRTKRNSLTQEVKRRLRNCHKDIPKDKVAEVLSKFAQKMRNSNVGHVAFYRMYPNMPLSQENLDHTINNQDL